MLKLRPTFEQIEREARTHRLKILPEKQKRTLQGILLDDVNFDDFDLSNYDKKALILIDNPDKATQTDNFNVSSSVSENESVKTPQEDVKERQTDESETIIEQQREQPERDRGKSIMRRMYDAMFSGDEYREEREELLRNRAEQTQEEPETEQAREQEEEDHEEDDDLPVNVKKSYEPSSSISSKSSTNRSALLPVEEEALSEHIQSSPPVSIQSSIPSNRTIEYIESTTPVQSVISSRRSQETIEYIRSRSSRGSVQSVRS